MWNTSTEPKIIPFQFHIVRNFSIFWFHSYQSRNNSKSGSSPKIIKFKCYPILIAVWALGCVCVPCFSKSPNCSALFFPGKISPLAAQVSLMRPVRSASLRRNRSCATCRNQGHRASLHALTHSTAGFRESEGRSTGARACHTSVIFEMLFLPLFSVHPHTSHFCYFTNCLHIDSNLTVADDTTEIYINTCNQILLQQEYWGSNDLH